MGGTWKCTELAPTHRWLSEGGGGVWGWGNDEGGEGGSEGGWGEALIEVLEQNRYRYFRLRCRNAWGNEIGMKSGGFPHF